MNIFYYFWRVIGCGGFSSRYFVYQVFLKMEVMDMDYVVYIGVFFIDYSMVYRFGRCNDWIGIVEVVFGSFYISD